MAKILASPGRYIQGPGEINRIREHLSRLDGPFLFVMGGHAYAMLSQTIRDSYGDDGMTVCERFQGECTREEISRLRTLFQEHGCRAVAGVGGGKAIDTAKGVAYYEACPVISIPTIASTDAPTCSIAVTYTTDHVFDGNLVLSRNPEIILVDTEIIARAPVRFLVCGMGDALSTFFEATANASSGHENFVGGTATLTSVALAELCYRTLIQDGLKAKEAAEQQFCTPELEHIIEANIYLSGVGFESNGLACAHSVYNALTTLPQCHEMYHGELVAFGTLVQLMLEKRPENEIQEVLRFCTSLGLPVTFDAICSTGLTPEDLMAVAAAACSPINFMAGEPFPVTEQMTLDALIAADARGRAFRM